MSGIHVAESSSVRAEKPGECSDAIVVALLGMARVTSHFPGEVDHKVVTSGSTFPSFLGWLRYQASFYDKLFDGDACRPKNLAQIITASDQQLTDALLDGLRERTNGELEVVINNDGNTQLIAKTKQEADV
jgi:hypothetical protein